LRNKFPHTSLKLRLPLLDVGNYAVVGVARFASSAKISSRKGASANRNKKRASERMLVFVNLNILYKEKSLHLLCRLNHYWCNCGFFLKFLLPIYNREDAPFSRINSRCNRGLLLIRMRKTKRAIKAQEKDKSIFFS